MASRVPSRASRGGRILLPAGLFFAALIPRLYHVNATFMGFADHNTSNWAIFARNLLERGWAGSRMGLIVNTGPDMGQAVRYFGHHPPTLALLTSLCFLVLGVDEVSARLVPLLLSALTCPLLFLLFRRALGTVWALLGAALFALAPGAVFYGQSLNPESFVAFLGAAAILSWCRLHETGERRWWRLCLALLAAAILTDWPGAYLAPALLAASALSGRTRPGLLRRTLELGLTAGGALTLNFLHILWVKGSFQDITEALAFRVLSSEEKPFTLLEYLRGILEQCTEAVTGPILALAAAGLVLAALRLAVDGAPALSRSGATAPAPAVGAALAISGTLHHVIFTNASLFNPNISYYLIPTLALLAAAAPALAASMISRRAGRLAGGTAGALIAVVSAILFAQEAPRLAHHLFNQYVSPGRAIVGDIVRRVVPPRAALYATCSMTSPQFRHYAWRRLLGHRRQPEILRGHSRPTYLLRDLNSRLSEEMERGLRGLPRVSALNFLIYDLGPDRILPRLPGVERPEMTWSLEEIRFGEELRLALHSVAPSAVEAPRPAWWERYLGVSWTVDRAAGRFVHASVVWERLEGHDGGGPLLPRYRLVLEGSGQLIHAPLIWPIDREDIDLSTLAPGETLRHDVTFFFSEWLPEGEYVLRAAVLAGGRLLPLRGASPDRLGPYARLGSVEFRPGG